MGQKICEKTVCPWIIGIDYEQIADFDLFIMLSRNFTVEDTKILFGDKLDFSKLYPKFDKSTNEIILLGTSLDGILIKIDSYTYMLITDFLRECHGLKPNREKAGNEFTKRFLIEEQRAEIEQNKDKKNESFFFKVIPKMICTPGFPYDYQSVQNITVAQFINSMKSVLHEKKYDYLMNGIYNGTVDSSKLTGEEKQWL